MNGFNVSEMNMTNAKNIIGVIPARYASTRFPGKPLAMIQGKPMIQWVYEGCRDNFKKLIVATDDARIMESVKTFGGEVMLTSTEHRSGTERCAEVVNRLQHEQSAAIDLVVNIQGDEPLVNIEQIDQLVQLLHKYETGISTLAVDASENDDIADPNRVKVVRNASHHALYFSRSPIPYIKKPATQASPPLIHLGLYAYRAEVLEAIVKLPESPLEKAEALEQLRWLENGYNIAVGISKYRNIGIDTPADIERLEQLL